MGVYFGVNWLLLQKQGSATTASSHKQGTELHHDILISDVKVPTLPASLEFRLSTHAIQGWTLGNLRSKSLKLPGRPALRYT